MKLSFNDDRKSRYAGLFAAALLLVVFTVGCRNTVATSATDEIDFNLYIENDDGEPLTGAKIASEVQPDGQLKITGLTDEKGQVKFAAIKAGEYFLEISRFAYYPVTVLTTVSRDNHELAITMTPSAITMPPTTGPPLPVTFARLTGQPGSYADLMVAVEGYYFGGFEISALASGLAPATFRPGNVAPVQPLIWIVGDLGKAVYDNLQVQTETPSGYPERFGRVFVTGLFEAGGRYGHLDAYQYRLTVTEAVLQP